MIGERRGRMLRGAGLLGLVVLCSIGILIALGRWPGFWVMVNTLLQARQG